MKSKTYDEFIEKFKPKLTTDDCATPELVYEAVKKWTCNEYGIDEEDIVRPFWPGQDFTKAEYRDGCVVIDNPPFSILSKICEWYLNRGIKFFLFAPSLTALSGKNVCMKMNHIICDAEIVYENGAKVMTAFVTNSGDKETVIQTAPELGEVIKQAVKKTRQETTKTAPKYNYPDHVVTAAMLQKYSKYGVEFSVKRKECVRISALDFQEESRKAIFGSGLLLSDDAAKRKENAERAAQERADAHIWELSEREKNIVKILNESRGDLVR